VIDMQICHVGEFIRQFDINKRCLVKEIGTGRNDYKYMYIGSHYNTALLVLSTCITQRENANSFRRKIFWIKKLNTLH